MKRILKIVDERIEKNIQGIACDVEQLKKERTNMEHKIGLMEKELKEKDQLVCKLQTQNSDLMVLVKKFETKLEHHELKEQTYNEEIEKLRQSNFELQSYFLKQLESKDKETEELRLKLQESEDELKHQRQNRDELRNSVFVMKQKFDSVEKQLEDKEKELETLHSRQCSDVSDQENFVDQGKGESFRFSDG